jgi:predicted RNA-binding Zn ribbon-like protein
MNTSPSAAQVTDTIGASFEFGGRLSLDLTWTLRYRSVWPTELLSSPDDLGKWLSASGLPTPVAPTARHLTRFRALREAIYRSASAVVEGHALEATDRELINHCAATPTPAPELEADGSHRLVATPGREAPAALSLIARDAIELLTCHDGRLRRCEGPMCSLLFHDASRPGNRRWCTTSRCGNKANTKAYRTRQRSIEQ